MLLPKFWHLFHKTTNEELKLLHLYKSGSLIKVPAIDIDQRDKKGAAHMTKVRRNTRFLPKDSEVTFDVKLNGLHPHMKGVESSYVWKLLMGDMGIGVGIWSCGENCLAPNANV